MRAFGLESFRSSGACKPRFFQPKSKSPAPVNISPMKPPTSAQPRAMIPPATAINTNAKYQLLPPDPGSDCGAELYIAHPHAAHHCQYSVNQAPEQQSPKTFSETMPPCDPGRYHQPAQQKRKYQPVWNPPAANVSNGRHKKHGQGRPPGIRVLQMLQTSSFSASRRDGCPIEQFCPHFRACQLSLDSMRYVGGIEASVHGSARREYPCAITGIHRSNA